MSSVVSIWLCLYALRGSRESLSEENRKILCDSGLGVRTGNGSDETPEGFEDFYTTSKYSIVGYSSSAHILSRNTHRRTASWRTLFRVVWDIAAAAKNVAADDKCFVFRMNVGFFFSYIFRPNQRKQRVFLDLYNW